MQLKQRLYYRMQLIRETENSIEKLFAEGKLRGTTHGSKGQEAIPVALCEFIDPEKDFICGGHRSHGHLLSLSLDVRSLIAELMTKRTGYVDGKGGSQHVRYKNFFCNGITGGMVPVSVGLAFAKKKMNDNGISVVFFGDGAMNEGYVMESFNLAAVYELPILFVLENNSYAMSTPVKKTNKVKFEKRVKGFGIDYYYMEANNVIKMYELSKKLINDIRSNGKPKFVEFKTHRFSGHSKSDNRLYIPKELDRYWKKNDPLLKLKQELDTSYIDKINSDIMEEIDNAINKSKEDPFPEFK